MKTLLKADYQHEKDGRLLQKVLKNGAIDTVMAFLQKNHIEDIYMYVFRSSFFPITRQTDPRVYALIEQACTILGREKIPEVYITRDYDQMISIGGLSSPFLVISTELLRVADEKMLFGLIASRIAGIQLEHHRALFVEWAISILGNHLPMAAVAVLSAVINDWKRCCYFTYDRVFYLATGDANVALAQILSPTIADAAPFRLTAPDSPFREQVDYFYGKHAGEGVLRVLHSLSGDQPWMPERYRELENYLRGKGIL